MNQKWKLAQQYATEIDEEERNKYERLFDLKDKCDKDEQELKLQYLILIRERNEYFKKLKLIQQVLDQHPDCPLISNIRKQFELANK
ncbi:hypothetical protein pb186bvf_018172 [Paramecium bursaria]